VISLLCGLALASEPQLQAGVHAGIWLHQAPRQVAVGLGGGLSARLASEHLDLYGGLAAYSFSAPMLGVHGGAALALPLGERYRPSLGLELAASFGGKLRLVSESQPLPLGTGPAVSARIRLRSLVFVRENLELSALEVAYGRPLEAPLAGHALGLDLLNVTARL
jgi:hypothetical protein